MKDQLDRITAARDKLRTAADTLTEALEHAETALSGLRLGVRAAVPLENEGQLCFSKHNQRWGLYFLPSRKPQEYVPIRSAPRRLRVLAAAVLPALADLLIETAAKELEQLEEANRKCAEFLAAFPEKEPLMAAPDVNVSRDGDMFLFTFNTAAAKAWQQENVDAEGWQWLGTNLAVEYRAAHDLVDGMRAAGLTVE